jgi:hypothetical protein
MAAVAQVSGYPAVSLYVKWHRPNIWTYGLDVKPAGGCDALMPAEV